MAHRCFLQSPEWEALQEALGKKTMTLAAGDLEGLVLLNPLPLGFSYLYAPRGPYGVFSKEALRAFALRAREKAGPKTLFLRVEPFEEETPEFSGMLLDAGFVPAAPVQPRETRIVDLAADENALLKNMEHDTRYAIRAAEKRGVAIEETNIAETPGAFGTFWDLFGATNEFHGLKAFTKAYYEAVAGLTGSCFSKIFIARREHVPVAAAIVVYYEDTATYLFAASKREFSKYNAPSFLLWEIMRRAKRDGYRTFDFWGVSRENKKWAGVTAFKKSFGGREVRYAGTWDLPFKKNAYRAYAALRKIAK